MFSGNPIVRRNRQNDGRGRTCGWRCHNLRAKYDQYSTADVAATVAQIEKIQQAGADIVRISVPSLEEAEAFGQIRKQVNIPLVADIHFDHNIALRVAD